MLIMTQLVGFLKFCAWIGVAGIVSTALSNGDAVKIYEGVKTIGGKRVKEIASIPLENEHTTVLGLTRHGKTYAIIQTLRHIKESVFFFNVQHEEVPREFTNADLNNTPSQIKKALQSGKKINYMPSSKIEVMQKELSAIVEHLYENKDWNVRFVVDEVHLMKKGALDSCIRVATTGLRHGIKAVFISQRPAKVDNTLYSQSTKHIIFALGKVDESYLDNYGFPVEEIVSKTRNEKYTFVTFDQKEVKGPYKIG
jgi:hypothetical protein